jgi:hypothetical protein
MDNNRMVRVIAGLKAGELVSLTPSQLTTAVKPSTEIISLEKVPELNELIGDEITTFYESGADNQSDLSSGQKKKKKKKKKKKR